MRYGANKKLNLPDAHVNLKGLPFDASSPLFAPVCIWNLHDKMFQTREFAVGVQKEISWIDSVSNASIDNWSKFHFSHSYNLMCEARKTLCFKFKMSLYPDKRHQLRSQSYPLKDCMQIVSRIT